MSNGAINERNDPGHGRQATGLITFGSVGFAWVWSTLLWCTIAVQWIMADKEGSTRIRSSDGK